MAKLKLNFSWLSAGMAALLLSSASMPAPAASHQQAESFSSFRDWCLNKERIDSSARHTVEVLLKRTDSEDCLAAGERLASSTELWLGFNEISDLRPLSGLSELTRLKLDGNFISDLRPLSGLNNLITLSLNNNKISDLRPLSGLTNLTTLKLDNNKIKIFMLYII